MKKAPTTVDGYLRTLSAEKRAALQKLRRTIRATSPKAEECISYGVPGFRLDGKLLVSYAAAAKHCSFFPGAYPIATHKRALGRYSTSKGTIRFQPDKPLPAALVRTLIKARLVERNARARSRAQR
jgi:uncharacterized protein YdhG (YjbR/CyaY superfamily)